MFKSKSTRGSLLVEAIVVLGLIATFTPLLYKHVSDRRTDIDNINRANSLLFMQQKTDEWMQDPNNSVLATLSASQPKTLVQPSAIDSSLARFDDKYLIGIRRQDVNGSPTYKALIIDTTDSGSDLKAGKIANLVGTSAGIYSAMDSANAWGVNGVWKEQISNYFDTSTTTIPTGSVVVTSEYSRAASQTKLSELLIDTNLDMGDYDIKTTGKIDAGTVVARNKFCIGDPTKEENCVTSMSEIGGASGACADVQLIEECDAGLGKSCTLAAAKDLNTGCSKIAAAYQKVAAYGCFTETTKDHNIAFTAASSASSGASAVTTIKTHCDGTSYAENAISTSTLSAGVADVYPTTFSEDLAFGVTTAGYYQIVLKGEAGFNSTAANRGAGAVVIANVNLPLDTVLRFKGIKGGQTSTATNYAGAGVALFEGISTDPVLVAGGGSSETLGGGGLLGGGCVNTADSSLCVKGFSLSDTGTTPSGGNTNYPTGTDPEASGALGGYYNSSGNYGYGGSGTVKGDCTGIYAGCKIIAGGNATASGDSYAANLYGNWAGDVSGSPATAYGVASITYCGSSASDCAAICSSDSDCSGVSGKPFCDMTSGLCVPDIDCTTNDAICNAHAAAPYCTDGKCSDDECSTTDQHNCTGTTPYCDTSTGKCEVCLTSANCPDATPICTINATTGNSCGACTGSSTVINSGCQAHNSSTPYCYSTDGQCYSDSCHNSCASGYTCTNGSCVKNTVDCTLNNYASKCSSSEYCVVDSTGNGTCESSYTCPDSSTGIKLGGTTWSRFYPMPTSTWMNTGYTSFYTPCRSNTQYMKDANCSTYYPTPTGKCTNINATHFTYNGNDYYYMNDVSWWEAQEICAKLSASENKTLSLPTDWSAFVTGTWSDGSSSWGYTDLGIAIRNKIGPEWFWTNDHTNLTNISGDVWTVDLYYSYAGYYVRSGAFSNLYVLCGSAFPTSCTKPKDCTDSSKPYCVDGTCSANSAVTACTDSSYTPQSCSTMTNASTVGTCVWINSWKNCSAANSCTDAQYLADTNASYQKPNQSSCTTLPTPSVYKASDNKKYFYTNNISWWEANEICEKWTKKYRSSNNGNCTPSATNTCISDNDTLSIPTDWSLFVTGTYSGGSITWGYTPLGRSLENNAIGPNWFWTNTAWRSDTSGAVWVVFMGLSFANSYTRYYDNSNYYVLCGSAETY